MLATKSFLLGLCFVSLIFVGHARAVIVPAAGALPNPSVPGDGLNGEWWANEGTISNNFDARNRTVHPVTAAFKSTTIDYPRGESDSIGRFTPFDNFIAPDTVSSGSGGSLLANSVMRLRGFINITQQMDNDPGNAFIDVDFAMSSDDGADVVINGVTVVNADGVKFFNYPRVPGTAKFESPGLYPIEIIYFESSPSLGGIELYSSIPGGRPDTLSDTGLFIIPTSVLYTVPEPAAAVCCAAVAMLSCVLRPRRMQSSRAG